MLSPPDVVVVAVGAALTDVLLPLADGAMSVTGVCDGSSGGGGDGARFFLDKDPATMRVSSATTRVAGASAPVVVVVVVASSNRLPPQSTPTSPAAVIHVECLVRKDVCGD